MSMSNPRNEARRFHGDQQNRHFEIKYFKKHTAWFDLKNISGYAGNDVSNLNAEFVHHHFLHQHLGISAVQPEGLVRFSKHDDPAATNMLPA